MLAKEYPFRFTVPSEMSAYDASLVISGRDLWRSLSSLTEASSGRSDFWTDESTIKALKNSVGSLNSAFSKSSGSNKWRRGCKSDQLPDSGSIESNVSAVLGSLSSLYGSYKSAPISGSELSGMKSSLMSRGEGSLHSQVHSLWSSIHSTQPSRLPSVTEPTSSSADKSSGYTGDPPQRRTRVHKL